jgi:hypothetical protein
MDLVHHVRVHPSLQLVDLGRVTIAKERRLDADPSGELPVRVVLSSELVKGVCVPLWRFRFRNVDVDDERDYELLLLSFKKN